MDIEHITYLYRTALINSTRPAPPGRQAGYAKLAEFYASKIRSYRKRHEMDEPTKRDS